jgi:hypothetical protein
MLGKRINPLIRPLCDLFGITIDHSLGRVIFLRMDASNLALYNTLGVEDKDDNFLEKKY